MRAFCRTIVVSFALAVAAQASPEEAKGQGLTKSENQAHSAPAEAAMAFLPDPSTWILMIGAFALLAGNRFSVPFD
jgi:hypothetical protein